MAILTLVLAGSICVFHSGRSPDRGDSLATKPTCPRRINTAFSALMKINLPMHQYETTCGNERGEKFPILIGPPRAIKPFLSLLRDRSQVLGCAPGVATGAAADASIGAKF